jgi:hypothetical protein
MLRLLAAGWLIVVGTPTRTGPNHLQKNRNLWHTRNRPQYKYFYMDQLTPKEQQLLAFALFITGMRIGPDVFDTLESIASKVGVEKPLELFAKDWTHFAQSFTEAAAQNRVLFGKRDPPETSK